MTRHWSRYDRQLRLLRRCRHLLESVRREMEVEMLEQNRPPSENYRRLRRLNNDITHELGRKI